MTYALTEIHKRYCSVQVLRLALGSLFLIAIAAPWLDYASSSAEEPARALPGIVTPGKTRNPEAAADEGADVAAPVNPPADGTRPVIVRKVPVADNRESLATADRLFAGETPKTIADLKVMQQRLQELSGAIMPTTVGVRLGQVRGSGVIVDEQGTVLTAAHVAQRPNIDCELVLFDGQVVKARTLGLNKNVDAGMIRITSPNPVDGTYRWTHAKLAEAPTKVGQWCLAAGHPGGYEVGRKPVLRLGRILESSENVLITDCTLVGGDSGGPLFNASGEVVGIHSRIGSMLASNLHVPAPAYSRSWERLVQAESWGHLPGQSPFLGVRGENGREDATIAEVFEGMPAAKAGIRVGDVIVRFAGKEVSDFTSLNKLVQDCNPDERVSLVVRRGEQQFALEVILGRR